MIVRLGDVYIGAAVDERGGIVSYRIPIAPKPARSRQLLVCEVWMDDRDPGDEDRSEVR